MIIYGMLKKKSPLFLRNPSCIQGEWMDEHQPILSMIGSELKKEKIDSAGD